MQLHLALKHANMHTMSSYLGSIAETRLEGTAFIACPPEAIPDPGQYLQANLPGDDDAVLPISLFRAAPELTPRPGASGFVAAPPLPRHWTPGTPLHLRGPLGHGFGLPTRTRRLALAAFDEHVARLLPLVSTGLARRAEIALFSDTEIPDLPSAVEANPLSALPDALGWADFLAIDLHIDAITSLRGALGLSSSVRPSCSTQALIIAPMPCGGMAACGVCAVKSRRGYKLTCEDGPVFSLESLAY